MYDNFQIKSSYVALQYSSTQKKCWKKEQKKPELDDQPWLKIYASRKVALKVREIGIRKSFTTK